MSKHDVKTYELNKISQAEAQNFGFMNLQRKSDLITFFFFKGMILRSSKVCLKGWLNTIGGFRNERADPVC